MRVVEEIAFGFREGQPKVELLLEERHCAGEVCHLKEAIPFRGDAGRELHRKGRKAFFENAFNLRLSVVVVYFDLVETAKSVAGVIKILGHFLDEGFCHQFRRASISLVYAKATPPHRNTTCKGHKATEEFSTNLDVRVPERLFSANQRTRMEAYARVHYVGKGVFEACDVLSNRNCLVVKDARNDVKTGWADTRIETARFVNEYAQCLPVGRHSIFTKKTGGDFSPPVRWGLPLPVGGSDLRLCQMLDFSNTGNYTTFLVAA